MSDIAPSRRHASIALCFAVAVSEGFDIQALGIAAPALRRLYGLSAIDLGWLFLASNAGLTLGAVSGGRLADRIGRKPVLAGAVALFGAFTFAVAAIDGFAALIVVRVLAGLGLGAGLTNMVAIASDLSSAARKARVTTLMFCGVPLGGAAVAALSHIVPLEQAWRGLFVLGGVVPLGLALAILAILPESNRHSTGATPAISVKTALFAEGRARSTVLLWLTFLPSTAALYLMLYWLPILVVAKGLVPDDAARCTMLFNLGGIVGALVFGWGVDRGPARVVLAAGYGALVVIGLALAGASAPFSVLALSGAAGFVLLGVSYALYGLVTSLYPPEAAGTSAGSAIGMGRVGSILGPLVPGLFAAAAAPTGVFWCIATAAAVAATAVLSLRMPGRTAHVTAAIVT